MLSDRDREIVYKFKEYLIDHFYMSRQTADDVYERFTELEDELGINKS